MSRVVSDPTAVVAGLGEPRRAEVRRLYSAADLTIVNVIWGPRMTIMPHNHLMWAVIGIYTGREANIFRRRLTDEPGGRVEAAGAKSLGERDAEPLGRDIIHSVTNPLSRLTSASMEATSLLCPAAIGIRRRSSNEPTTWRRICACSRTRIRLMPIRISAW